MNYHHLYLLYLYYFNFKRDYYECHDVLEELWLNEGCYPFYQGLIQIAVGLYHYKWQNVKGSILLFEGGIQKLSKYPEKHYGINVDKLLNESIEYTAKLHHIEQKPFCYYDLTIEIVDSELQDLVTSIDKEMKA